MFSELVLAAALTLGFMIRTNTAVLFALYKVARLAG